jgi:hypothetical protein
VASAPSRARPLPAQGTASNEADVQLRSLRKQLGYGRRLRPNRNYVVLLAVIVIGFWVLLGFGRTITQLNAATDRQAELTTETVALTNRLDAGHRELQLVQTDAFQALQARGFSVGAPGEVSFSVTSDLPAPRVVPLGDAIGTAAPQTPLDAWLRMLFGE